MVDQVGGSTVAVTPRAWANLRWASGAHTIVEIVDGTFPAGSGTCAFATFDGAIDAHAAPDIRIATTALQSRDGAIPLPLCRIW